MRWLEPDKFEWGSPDDTSDRPPLSSFSALVTTCILYVILVIFATVLSRKFIPPIAPAKKNDDMTLSSPSNLSSQSVRTDLQWRPWFNSDLKFCQIVHNIVLVVGSAVMLYGVVRETLRRLADEGGLSWPSFLLCEEQNPPTANGALYYWSYIYYLSKYYELLDTVLQLARGKPPPHFVLHVYHHAFVLVMAWGWCETKQSLQFIGLSFNAAVHVVMYSYFLQRTLTKTIPRWKAFVTLFQIIQFAFSMVATIATLFVVFVQKYDCAGMTSLFWNVIFNITLLHSFVNVYRKGRQSKNKKAKMVKV